MCVLDGNVVPLLLPFPAHSPLAEFFREAVEAKVIHTPVVIFFFILIPDSEQLLKRDGWGPGVFSLRVGLYPWHVC